MKTGIIYTTTPVYEAQANPTESVNRVLKTIIVFFLYDYQQDWDAYTSAVHGTL